MHSVTKTYGHYVRDRIEPAIHDWLKAKIKGNYEIKESELDPKTMTRTIKVGFEDKNDGQKFSLLRIPVDLFKEKWGYDERASS
jgi:hypothetical protein